MRTFQYINRDIVNPIDLNTLSKTYSTLEQGHQQAVKAASDLQTAMAQLELNEAEDAWRQQRINEIQQTIADNTTFGNAYGALDDIIAKAGDLSSDAGMIGRLRAQQDYKAYQQKIDAMNIPEHYKDYYKRANPYYYQDKYDDKGNVIGGSKWNENSSPVATQDYNKLMQLAIQYTSPHKSNSVVTRYLNADNSITTAPKDPNATPVLYDTTTYNIQELTKEDLRYGLEAALKAAPEYIDSLKQDYKIALDDYKNGIPGLYNVSSRKGGHMTFDEFKDSIFEPMYKSKSYKYVDIVSQKQNTNLVKDFNNSFGGGNDFSKYNSEKLSPYGVPGENVYYENRSIQVSLSNLKDGNKKIKSIYHNIASNTDINNIDDIINKIDLRNPAAFEQAIPILLGDKYNNLNVDLANRNEVKNAFSKLGISEEEIEKEMEYYDSIIKPYKKMQILYAEDIHNANKFNEETRGTKANAAINTMSNILSGEFPPEEEMNNYEKRFSKEWSSMLDSYYFDNAKYVGWSITDKKAKETFEELLKQNNLSNSIVKETGKEGQFIYKLPYEKREHILKFGELIEQARGSRNVWHKFWQDIKGEFSNKGDKLFYEGEDNIKRSYHYNGVPIYSDENNSKIYLEGSKIGVGLPISIFDNITPVSIDAMIRHQSRGNFIKTLNHIPIIESWVDTLETGAIVDTSDVLQGMFTFKDRLNRYAKGELEKTDRQVQSIDFTGATPEAIIAHAENLKLANSNLDKEEKAKLIRNNNTIIDAAKESTLNAVKNISFENSVIKVLNENNILSALHGADLTKLKTEFVENIKDADINVKFDPQAGKYVHEVTYNYKNEDEEMHTRVFTIDAPNGSELDILNTDPSLNAKKDFMTSQVENKDIRIGNLAGKEDIYSVPMGDGRYAIQLENSDTFKIIDSNTKEGTIDFENLINLKYLINKFNNFDYYYTNVNQEKIYDDINTYKTILAYFLGKDITNKDIDNLFNESVAKEIISNNFQILWD